MKRTVLALAVFAFLSATAGEVVRNRVIPLRELGLAKTSFACGDEIGLSLFDDVSFLFKIVSVAPSGVAGRSCIAVDADSGASAVATASGNSARIDIDDFKNRRQYSVRVKDGTATIVERDNSGADADGCGTCRGETPLPQAVASSSQDSAEKAKSRMLSSAASSAFDFAETNSVVDILVVFDRGAEARSAQLGYESVEECAEAAVARMNMVLVCSRLDSYFQYRLAGVTTVDETFTAVDNATLNKLRTSAGVFGKIPALRAKCGADTVTLLINRTEGSTNGIAYGLSSITDPAVYNDSFPYRNNYACNVCFIDRVFERYTMSHETGHNMGCGHSNLQYESNPRPESEPYSFGYHFFDAKGIRRATVMAYTYTAFDSNYYYPIPYFSSPDIAPEEYGVPVGTETNDNRRVLTISHNFAGRWRDRTIPYDWDVRVWENGREIQEGDFCDIPSGFYHSFTFTHENPDATIYYTLDGTEPNRGSSNVPAGGSIQIDLYNAKTLKVCAEADGIVRSPRTLTLREGMVWSGEAGLGGSGSWTADGNIESWCDCTKPFYRLSTSAFLDIPLVPAVSVEVHGAIEPYSAVFDSDKTSYTFCKGDEEASLALRDPVFAPDCNLVFNVPVKMDAVVFTNMGGRVLSFNAPFGQTVDAGGGSCTNMLSIGPGSILSVSPGKGRTQTLDKLNNIGWYSADSTFRVGEGTVVFTGAINGGAGVAGRTKIEIDGGTLEFAAGGATGYSMDGTSLSVANGGEVRFRDMEHLRRSLQLDGGTVYAKRFDLMGNPGVHVTGDSSMEDNGGGYILVRNANADIDVSPGAVFTLNIGTQTDGRGDTDGWGIVKHGEGTLAANAELKHSGATIVSNGVLAVGYTSGSTAHGQGWIAAPGATLHVVSGASLKVPSLELAPASTLSLSASEGAPVTVAGSASLAGARIVLSGASSLSEGERYPLVSAEGAISGADSLDLSGLPALASGRKWTAEIDGGTLYAKVSALTEDDTVLVIPAGETFNLSDVPAEVETIAGEGTLYCGAALPSRDYGLADSAWKGTVAFEGFDYGDETKDFRFELYGNAQSKIGLKNCKINYLKNNNAFFPGTLVLDGDAAFLTGNGYSSNYNIFGVVEGDGVMSFTGSPQQAYVFETATGFTGAISVGAAADRNAGGDMRGRRIVFGDPGAGGAGLPDRADRSATITVLENAEASIGSRWYAYRGVEIAGTLIVKTPGAALDCETDVSNPLGILFDGGAALEFESSAARLSCARDLVFTNGTVEVSFADGGAPSGGATLVAWPATSTVAGRFKLVGSATNGYELAACPTGLQILAKPSDRIDLSGYSYLTEGKAGDWLDDNNFSLYDGTWKDFMGERCAANGYTYLQNFLLGYDVDAWEDPPVFTAEVFIDADGNVIVRTNEKKLPSGLGLVKRLYAKERLSDDWPEEGVVMEGRSATIESGAAGGFYKVEINVE